MDQASSKWYQNTRVLILSLLTSNINRISRDRLKDNQSTITYKALSMNVRNREIEKLIESIETEIQHRKTMYRDKQQETRSLKLQKRDILISLNRFTEVQQSKASEILAKLKQIPEQQFSSIDLKAIRSPKRIFSLIIITFISVFHKEKILTNNPTESQAVVEVLRNKQKLVAKLEEAAKYDEKSFKVPNLKLFHEIGPVFTTLVALEEEKLSPLFQALYKWCEFWYSQVLIFYELEAKVERLKTIEVKLSRNDEYISDHEKNVHELEHSLSKLQGEKQVLTTEDAELNLSLAAIEVESSQFEMIDKALLTLEKKFTRKLHKLESTSETLEGDLLLVALDLAYLGILRKKNKVAVLGRIITEYTNGGENEEGLKFSKKWTFEEDYLEKLLKTLLKVGEKGAMTKRLQFNDEIEKLPFYELMTTEILEKESPELKEFTKGNVVLLTSLGFKSEDFMPMTIRPLLQLEELDEDFIVEDYEELLIQCYGTNLAENAGMKHPSDYFIQKRRKLDRKAKELVNRCIVIGINLF